MAKATFVSVTCKDQLFILCIILSIFVFFLIGLFFMVLFPQFSGYGVLQATAYAVFEPSATALTFDSVENPSKALQATQSPSQSKHSPKTPFLPAS
jgi:hypothetical protein